MLHMKLKIDGKEVKHKAGEHESAEIPLFQFSQSSISDVQATGDDWQVGDHAHSPLNFTREMDEVSVHLLKALTEKSKVEGTIECKKKDGKGKDETFYELDFKDGRISHFNQDFGDQSPGREAFQIVAKTYKWKYGKVEHEDSPGGKKGGKK